MQGGHDTVVSHAPSQLAVNNRRCEPALETFEACAQTGGGLTLVFYRGKGEEEKKTCERASLQPCAVWLNAPE